MHKAEIQAYVAKVKPIFVVAGVFSLFVNLLMLVPSLYMLQVYDRVLTSRNVDTLLMLSLLVVVLYGVLALIEWIRSQLLVNAGVELDLLLSPRLFDAFIKYRAQTKGSAPDAAFSDATTLRQFLTGNALFALFDAPWAPVFIIVIYFVHPALAAVTLVGALLLLGLAWVSHVVTQGPLAKANALQGTVFSGAAGYGRSHESIVAMGMLRSLRNRWLEVQHRLVTLQAEAARKSGLLASASRLIRMVQQTAILGVGALFVIKGELSPGGMIAASILMGRALAPLDLAIASWRQFVAARAAYGRLGNLLERVPADPPRIELPVPTGDVSIEGITVVPPGAETPALTDIDFKIRPGMTVGVVGPSGSGKSCLARALAGIWVPVRGDVRLDGASLKDWDRDQLGPYMGYLPQSIELIDGTVAENIGRFGKLDSDGVIAAAMSAGIHDMVMRLPRGYETEVGMDGVNLSGGQRQRLALARAIYGRPRFVVLDEPNSNLDEQGEVALMKCLAEMKTAGTTVVVITHRRPILSATDGLLVLEAGRLVVYGPTASVLQTLSGQAKRPLGVVQ